MTLMIFLFPLIRRSRLSRLKIKVIPHASIIHSIIISNLYSSNSNAQKNVNLNKMSTTDYNLFEGKNDRYNGVTVQSDKEKCNSFSEFTKKLEDSIIFWKKNGKRGIWFKVHLDQSEWVPVLVKKGFKFHHAREEFVMMYLWLPPTENCNIPHYAHTMIGVGAVVVNNRSQVLVVMEKYRLLNTPYWKLPGGYVEPGENLVDAAIREVKEETNISTEFQSVLTLTHAHGRMFGCSDIYAVVSLKPLSQDIEKCIREIDQCKWMDIEEYLNHPQVHELNRFFLQKYLEYDKHNIKINCFHGIHKVVKLPYTFYSVTKSDGQNGENADVILDSPNS